MKIAILLGVMFCSLTAVPQENNEHYVVAKGDSAAAICRKFQISTNELLASNPGLNLTRLAVGQRVKIPSNTNSANLANGSTSSRADTSSQEFTAHDRAFFERIQKAVLTNDIEWLSGAISYPLVVKRSTENVTLRNSDDFKKHSVSILTPHLKSAVRNQSPDSLFKNWSGVMIGNGVIWFSEVREKAGEDWKYRIIGMNPEDRSPPKKQEK